MRYRVFIKYFTLSFILSFALTTAVMALTTAAFDIVPIGENGVYSKGSHCLINMEEKHTDEYELKLIFNQCLSAHADYLYSGSE
jgi:hypothetical protein